MGVIFSLHNLFTAKKNGDLQKQAAAKRGRNDSLRET